MDSGGLDTLFKTDKLELILEKEFNMGELVHHLANNYLKTRRELFIVEDGLRPGILVMINESDWELIEKEDY